MVTGARIYVWRVVTRLCVSVFLCVLERILPWAVHQNDAYVEVNAEMHPSGIKPNKLVK